jgi:hypothetical protein
MTLAYREGVIDGPSGPGYVRPRVSPAGCRSGTPERCRWPTPSTARKSPIPGPRSVLRQRRRCVPAEWDLWACNPREPRADTRVEAPGPRMMDTTGAPDARFIHPWAFYWSPKDGAGRDNGIAIYRHVRGGTANGAGGGPPAVSGAGGASARSWRRRPRWSQRSMNGVVADQRTTSIANSVPGGPSVSALRRFRPARPPASPEPPKDQGGAALEPVQRFGRFSSGGSARPPRAAPRRWAAR